MNLLEISNTLREGNDGIWTAPGEKTVSYPDAHDILFDLEENSFWFRHRNKIILSAVKRFNPAGPFLDVGGGNGFVARELDRNGIDVALVEPALAGTLNAKRRGLQTVVNSTLQDARFKPNSAGAIGLFDVLEHLEDDGKFLAAAHEVLNPAGLLFISVPANNFLWSTEDEYAGHFRRYSAGSLSAVLETNGFEVKYLSYFFAPLLIPVFMLRALPYRLGFKRTASPDLYEREHGTGLKNRQGIIDSALDWEISWAARGKQIPAGTSILCVAAKRAPNAD